MPIQKPARADCASCPANVIGPMIVRLRYAHGWTQDELARELYFAGYQDVTREIVANVESRRTRATCLLIQALARVFGIHEGELFPSREAWPPQETAAALRRRRRRAAR